MELQVRHSSFFSSPVDSIQVLLLIISFSSFQIPSHASAPHNHSLLAIHLFGSAEDISEGSSFHSRSVQTYLRGRSLILDFLFNRCNLSFKSFYGVSFEWALTHRSFPRILPYSSHFSRSYPKFFSKFDVRMIYHQTNVFSKIFQIIFIVGSTSSFWFFRSV